MIFKLGDLLFSKSKTLSDIVHDKICDKVIDGTEYQLVRRSDLVSTLSSEGAKLTISDQLHFKDLFRPLFQDYIDLKPLLNVFASLGIAEKMPLSTKHLDFDSLSGSEIRFFNRIIK